MCSIWDDPPFEYSTRSTSSFHKYLIVFGCLLESYHGNQADDVLNAAVICRFAICQIRNIFETPIKQLINVLGNANICSFQKLIIH